MTCNVNQIIEGQRVSDLCAQHAYVEHKYKLHKNNPIRLRARVYRAARTRYRVTVTATCTFESPDNSIRNGVQVFTDVTTRKQNHCAIHARI